MQASAIGFGPLGAATRARAGGRTGPKGSGNLGERPPMARDTLSLSKTAGTPKVQAAAKAPTKGKPSGNKASVDLTDPAALGEHAANKKKRFGGSLFSGGASADDVRQGNLGDCVTAAAAAALARMQPKKLQEAIKANGDGTYTVKLWKKDELTGKFSQESVKVDGDLYVDGNGRALYGHSAKSGDTKSMELWFAILEKALAAHAKKQTYGRLGGEGIVDEAYVMEAILGRSATETNVVRGLKEGITTKDKIWSGLQQALSKKQPVVAASRDDASFDKTGVYSEHAYTVMSVAVKGGVKYVQLRNPWGGREKGYGSGKPAEPVNAKGKARDGKYDGVFEIKFEDFCTAIGVITTA